MNVNTIGSRATSESSSSVGGCDDTSDGDTIGDGDDSDDGETMTDCEDEGDGDDPGVGDVFGIAAGVSTDSTATRLTVDREADENAAPSIGAPATAPSSPNATCE